MPLSLTVLPMLQQINHNTFAAPHPFASEPSDIKMLIAELDAIIAAH